MQAGLHLLAVEILVQARHVGARFLGGGERLRLADLAARGEQLLVERPEFVGADLHPQSVGDLRRLNGIGAKHREFFQDHAEIRVLLDEGSKIVERAFAIAAIVIVKLDQRDLARRVSNDDLPRGIIDFWGQFGHRAHPRRILLRLAPTL